MGVWEVDTTDMGTMATLVPITVLIHDPVLCELHILKAHDVVRGHGRSGAMQAWVAGKVALYPRDLVGLSMNEDRETRDGLGLDHRAYHPDGVDSSAKLQAFKGRHVRKALDGVDPIADL